MASDKIQRTMTKPLTIYKASAGSGKTFTLATEYMKLLVSNPYDFRGVLAVTFTNKATEEMKLRILSQLYGVWKALPDSQSYTNVIVADLGISPSLARQRAGLALRLLLHNYSHFRIETIDSFFQSVLRNLARELDLAPNLHVWLNDRQVEEQAVDGMIEGLSVGDELLEWIMGYVRENISEDKSWNVVAQVKEFGMTIFKDFYRQAEQNMSGEVMTNAFFADYAKSLRAEMDSAARRMARYAEAFDEAIAAVGLAPGDFRFGQNGVAGFFAKLACGTFKAEIVGKRVADCNVSAEAWSSKSSPKRQQIISLASEKLMPLLARAIEDRPVQWSRLKSAELTLAHLSQLRLLKSIDEKVRQINSEANRFMLCDTQHLLMSLISDSDTPFVYEKTGTHLKHIMIDEFQDTSAVQWRNFKVLLQECMSHDYAHNIIVGDVKQSIYRWRGSDWRMLNDIGAQFTAPARQLDVKTLARNYRSMPNIVGFNNAFFASAAQAEHDRQAVDAPHLARQLSDAYADVAQETPPGKAGGGFVSVTLLPADDYRERTLQAVGDVVEDLLAKGTKPSDICILLRYNDAIPAVARHFMQRMPALRVVSDQAFRLDASTAVGMMVGAMRIVAGSSDRLTLAAVAKPYAELSFGDARAAEQAMLSDDLWELLPKAFVASLERLRTEPLYGLAEQIYYMFGLKRLTQQSAYVCAFFDQLEAFTEDMQASLDSFLERWDEELSATTIQAGEVDGLRIMSIHKSKGLEFHNVIVPFCDWQLEKSRGNVIWCSPKQEPYSRLPLVPVDYSSKLMGTIYERDYLEERLQNSVDNLNLLYVAFTRAGGNLFVVGKRDAKGTRSALIEECLPAVAEALQGSSLSVPDDKEQPIEFSFGEVAVRSGGKKAATDNVFLMQPEPVAIDIATYAGRHEFRQSNKSRDFVSGEDGGDANEYVRMGSVLHSVLSAIKTTDDVEPVLRSLEADGVVCGGALTQSRVVSLLRSRMGDERVRQWFSGQWQVYNECTLLHVDKGTGKVVRHRPDRVMVGDEGVVVVDFKFGRRRDEYCSQVRLYKDLLADMGHVNVKGYLWYVYTNEIEEV